MFKRYNNKMSNEHSEPPSSNNPAEGNSSDTASGQRPEGTQNVTPLPVPVKQTETAVEIYNGETNLSKKDKNNNWLRRLFLQRSDDERLREQIEELIEEENGREDELPSDLNERVLLSNILKLRDMTAYDVMVPRADIIAVESGIKKDDLLKVYADTPRSRLPVYNGTLDDIIGTVHMKDFLGQIANGTRYNLSKITREVPIISPAMAVLDLLIQMRETRNHMALVVDEYGGIDGVVTLGDVIEAITGEIDDIYDDEVAPMIKDDSNGVMIADARLPINEFEEKIGMDVLDDDEREEIDTIAGFVFSLAGRVPTKGEIIEHPDGFVFDVLEGDTRRIKKIRIRRKNTKNKLPQRADS